MTDNEQHSVLTTVTIRAPVRAQNMVLLLAEPVTGERLRADGTTARWRVALPPHLGPCEPPFVIEHAANSAEWTREDRAERAFEVHPIGRPARLASIDIPVPAVGPVKDEYLRDVGLHFQASVASRGTWVASVARQTIRLRPGSDHWPIIVIQLLEPAIERREADLLECHWVLEPV